MRTNAVVAWLIAFCIAGTAKAQAPDCANGRLFMSNFRDTIDSIAQMAIDSCCFPGCQIYAMRGGKEIFSKAYGYFTYPAQDSAKWRARQDSLSAFHAAMPFCPECREALTPHKVETADIYDLASVTKAAATTLMAMRLASEGKICIDSALGCYLKSPYPGKSKVLDASLRSLLEHRSGIKAWTPITRFSNYWWGWRINCRILGIEFDTAASRQAIISASFNELFSRQPIPGKADRRVAEGVYLRNSYQDSLRRFYFEHGTEKRKSFQYSDINMIYLQWAAESAAQCGIQQYMDSIFYKPMGLATMGYLPLQRFPKERIAPTEAHQWSGKMLIGDVHDPSAALLGGVAGNAGLFASAQDLGKLFQMLLDKGLFNGRRYLDSAWVETFTAQQPGTIRGLGFDMLPTVSGSDLCSSSTFGHTGFTGPCVWADPETGIVIAITCNRVYPTQENKKMIQMRICKKIGNAIYQGCGIQPPKSSGQQ